MCKIIAKKTAIIELP